MGENVRFGRESREEAGVRTEDTEDFFLGLTNRRCGGVENVYPYPFLASTAPLFTFRSDECC
jgi:hypothetical protein